MNLRRIEAATYREALAKVRAVYGEDALIVGTRTLQRGGVLGLGGRQVVEVYVTDTQKRLEQLKAARAESAVAAPAPLTNPAVPAAPSIQPPPGLSPQQLLGRQGERAPSPEVGTRLKEINEVLEELRGEVHRLLRRSEGPPWGHRVLEEAFALLRDLDVEEKIARDILAGLDRQVVPDNALGDGALRGLLVGHVARFITEKGGHAQRREGGVRILVGPTGVGKTTSIAKLAARERYTCGRRVGLVTLDTFRIAAVDQLKKYAEIIGLQLRVATDPANFRELVSSLEGCDVVFVDSAGRSPADEMRVGELEAFVRAVPDATVSLVLSVTAGARTVERAIDRFRRVGFRDLILTKLDETQSPGVILSAVNEAERPVSYVANGQNVPDDLEVMDPQRLADLVLQGA